jgi:hypothetical protein
MVKNGVKPGITLQFVSNIRKTPAGGKGVLKRGEDISRALSHLCLYLLRRLRNRYPCITEVILYNVRIVTDHIDALLQKHFELLCNEILVLVPLFLNEFLEYAKVLLNRIKVRRIR